MPGGGVPEGVEERGAREGRGCARGRVCAGGGYPSMH